jgi:uncharacterized protein YqjF (DUF2071 family)
MSERRPFLTAKWKDLVVLNYEVPREVLVPHVPKGTEVDLFEGKALVSVVAFRFEDTRLFGAIPTPPSPDFEEVNLRFYVRRVEGSSRKRGVCFVREVVPSRLVAWTARTLYEEPYERHAMGHTFAPLDSERPERGGTFTYTWRSDEGAHRVGATTTGELHSLAKGSLDEFILEHYWGYTARSDGTTSEYEVTHPPWRVWSVASWDTDDKVGAFYGGSWATLLAVPCSAVVAEGSPVAVYSGHTLA